MARQREHVLVLAAQLREHRQAVERAWRAPRAARHASRQQSSTAERPRPVRQWTATTFAASARSHASIEAHASTSIRSGGQR